MPLLSLQSALLANREPSRPLSIIIGRILDCRRQPLAQGTHVLDHIARLRPQQPVLDARQDRVDSDHEHCLPYIEASLRVGQRVDVHPHAVGPELGFGHIEVPVRPDRSSKDHERLLRSLPRKNTEVLQQAKSPSCPDRQLPLSLVQILAICLGLENEAREEVLVVMSGDQSWVSSCQPAHYNSRQTGILQRASESQGGVRLGILEHEAVLNVGRQ